MNIYWFSSVRSMYDLGTTNTSMMSILRWYVTIFCCRNALPNSRIFLAYSLFYTFLYFFFFCLTILPSFVFLDFICLFFFKILLLLFLLNLVNISGYSFAIAFFLFLFCILQAPIIPEVQFDGDTSNFDDYPESDWKPAQAVDQSDYQLFKDF